MSSVGARIMSQIHITKGEISQDRPPSVHNESIASSSDTPRTSGEAELEAGRFDEPKVRWVYGSDPNDRANFGYMKLVPVKKTDLAVSIPILPNVPLNIIVPTIAKGSRVLEAVPTRTSNNSDLSTSLPNSQHTLNLPSLGPERTQDSGVGKRKLRPISPAPSLLSYRRTLSSDTFQKRQRLDTRAASPVWTQTGLTICWRCQRYENLVCLILYKALALVVVFDHVVIECRMIILEFVEYVYANSTFTFCQVRVHLGEKIWTACCGVLCLVRVIYIH